ncbi:ABC transporter ATP-binding protein, partial [Oryctes borbonicus]
DPKQILKDINGHFRSGKLIGILGPSGAGKTTLLNVLAGYINNSEISGQISVNNEPRKMHQFKKISCYIVQEDVLQKQLSVAELMNLAADLKLGTRFTAKEKSKIVKTVVQTIGLEACLNTRSESLSGGQTKRLAIALELINNPPV